jgi:uncharacterized protein involved in high-affinity Fe2+ transport
MKARFCVPVLAVLALALGGCAAADKNAPNAAEPGTGTTEMNMSGSGSAGSSGGSAVGSSGPGMTSMSGMKTTTIVNSRGVATPVPIKTIGRGTWKDMDITAQEMTPVPFYIDEGTSYREIKPTPKSSFHLMVMLTDKHTGVAIPYATVWVVIKQHGKTVFNERQWPMLSEFMGPHYGNDVALPGPGMYHLSVQVSAPEAALHVEYGGMWSGTHTVDSTFTWR